MSTALAYILLFALLALLLALVFDDNDPRFP
jgi:hypothetical protein